MAQRYRLGHLSALLRLLADEIGEPHAERTDLEWQDLGLRVEYVADLLAEHVDDLERALETLERDVRRT